MGYLEVNSVNCQCGVMNCQRGVVNNQRGIVSVDCQSNHPRAVVLLYTTLVDFYPCCTKHSDSAVINLGGVLTIYEIQRLCVFTSSFFSLLL